MSMGKEILLIRTALTDEQLHYLNAKLEKKYCVIYKPEKDEEVSENIKQYVKVIIVHELAQSELDKYTVLAYVQIYGRGTDKVCTNLLDRRNIYYQCCKGTAIAESVAEYVLLQILYWERKFSELNDIAHHGSWSWEWRRQFQYKSLCQIKVGVVGKGRIGKAVSDLLLKFGISVFFINAGQRMMQADIKKTERMDYITVHLPLNSSTENIINMEFFSRMGHNAVLINTSRGRIVNEKHLFKALEKEIIRAASLDVTEKEPIASKNALSFCDKVIITPHIAGRTKKALSETIREITDNIEKEVWKWRQC